MSLANMLHEGVSITPQQLFRMGPPQRREGFNRLTMDIAGLDSDTVSPTAHLGLLVDDIIGFTLWDRRGSRAGLVTADLSVDFVTPTGWTGPEVHADGRVVAVTADGGAAVTEIRDGAGTLLATGTAWGNFVEGDGSNDEGSNDEGSSGDGPRRATAPPISVPPVSVPPLERIGGYLTSTAGTRLVVPPNPALANKLGVMHGGIQTCAIDLVGNAAAGSTGAPMHTASMRINFFRPLPVETDATFVAEVVRAGRSVTVLRVTGTDAADRVCTIATVTCRRPSPRVDLAGDRAAG